MGHLQPGRALWSGCFSRGSSGGWLALTPRRNFDSKLQDRLEPPLLALEVVPFNVEIRVRGEHEAKGRLFHGGIKFKDR